MSNKHLGKIILFGTLVLACLLILQVYYFRKAFDVAEKQFDHSVQIALRKVADSISIDSEVKRLSSNFFYVTTESELNDRKLDELIGKEFLLRSLNVDYELGVYNADDDTLVYGNYVKATRKNLEPISIYHTEANADKNFAVYFPGKNSYVVGRLDVWMFSTVVLLMMTGFFAYAIYSLLRERKFSSLKTDFVNNMTHEFRTPVTNIGIAGEIIKKRLGEMDGNNVYVDILLRENEKLRVKIDQILLGASAEAMKKPVLNAFNVHQAISDCAEAFRLKIEERRGSLVLEFKAANTTIQGDRDLLAQAISNVIDNAEKYSVNHPQIFVRTRNLREGIEIEIADKGVGIAKEMKSKVFQKFFRVGSGNVYNVKGFGLGLSFVKGVVQSHRGKVTLISELHQGTEVRIFLPNA
ncbi:MAG: HAMP domain-containing sensor histidine kinase [Chryseolinea sp.]